MKNVAYESDLSATLFYRNLLGFQKFWAFLGIFNQFLSTQNVNVARFAMSNETFSVIFKHCVVVIRTAVEQDPFMSPQRPQTQLKVTTSRVHLGKNLSSKS